MGVIKFDSACHWYRQNGAAAYDADLRVARKEYLYPSVTTIDKQWFANPFLENWKSEQLVLACIDNPRQPHESAESYGQRVYEASTTKTRVAAEFGKGVHSVVEQYPKSPSDGEFIPWFDQYSAWHEKNISEVIASEGTVLDHDIGVAGRFDRLVIHKEHGIVMLDYKTQGVKVDDKERKKPAFYEAWIRQLAFYSSAALKRRLVDTKPRCMSLVIDSKEASPPYEKLWTEEEQQGGLEDFTFAAYGWFKRKKFWPTKTQWKPYDILTA